MSSSEPQLDSNKRLAARFLEAASLYRVEECLSLMTPDATWWVSGDPARLKVSGTKDRAQVGRLLQGLATFIPKPMHMSIEGMTAQDDRVAVEAKCAGIWRNGSPYLNAYHFLFVVRSGLIGSVREYMDTLHLFDTLNGDDG